MLGNFRHLVFGGLTALVLGVSIAASTSEPAAAQWGGGGWGGGWHRGWGGGGWG